MTDRLVYEETKCCICGDPVPLPWNSSEPSLCVQCAAICGKSTEQLEKFGEYLRRRKLGPYGPTEKREMSRAIDTVGELRELLKYLPDNFPIEGCVHGRRCSVFADVVLYLGEPVFVNVELSHQPMELEE